VEEERSRVVAMLWIQIGYVLEIVTALHKQVDLSRLSFGPSNITQAHINMNVKPRLYILQSHLFEDTSIFQQSQPIQMLKLRVVR
jgi:hypothetical protein